MYYVRPSIQSDKEARGGMFLPPPLPDPSNPATKTQLHTVLRIIAIRNYGVKELPCSKNE